MRNAQAFSTNQLRILALIDPTTLESVGTREAEGQSIAFAHMADHARNYIGEHGYLNQTRPTSVGLARYHMDDNVTAVHIMGPFGRLGAAGYLAVLFAGLLCLAMITMPRGAPHPALSLGHYGAVLSIGMIVMVSAYMVLGNLGAAPFTGRNAYLLVVRSVSDFAEAMVLFCLAALFVGMGARHNGER